MVNSEEFTKRLKLILEYYNISAAILAEKMDVQRSSISHILSGRNKPSLDFVMKILKAFPDVELYWLLNGVGEFPKKIAVKKVSPPSVAMEQIKSTQELPVEKNIHISNDSEIERIVIFYKDGSFKNYMP